MKNGITLVALVITIIVLLILAGVSLNAVFNQDGIFSRAEQATVRDENGKVYEELRLHAQSIQLDSAEEGTYSSKMFEEFKKRDYINEDGTVNMEEISSSTTITGNGSEETGDIYKIKRADDSTGYYLFYYDEENNEINLGKLFEEELSLEEIIAKEDGDCMIDEYGNIMPITTWNYYLSGEDTCCIEGEVLGTSVSKFLGAYNGTVTENGQLEYNLPVLVRASRKNV